MLREASNMIQFCFVKSNIYKGREKRERERERENIQTFVTNEFYIIIYIIQLQITKCCFPFRKCIQMQRLRILTVASWRQMSVRVRRGDFIANLIWFLKVSRHSNRLPEYLFLFNWPSRQIIQFCFIKSTIQRGRRERSYHNLYQISFISYI